MRRIVFATGNRGKLCEAQALMPPDVVLEARRVAFDEPRSDDLRAIAGAKLRQARAEVDGPVLVQDSGFYIGALNGFPGSYVNHALNTIGVAGILKLMEGVPARGCCFKQCLAYWDGAHEHYFACEDRGTLSTSASAGESAEQWSGLWSVFIPEGADRTLLEFTDEMLRARRLRENGTLRQLSRFLNVEE